ncbi:CDI toxin immunity protein [Paenibacillus caseinilyticus]|uniref:Uncharacterized protein n=1 Tax=Paenibacillus mucilaginosus K02 TaxID=997761 RepID=I0BP10_9BACL|nr:hypothetical protein [Paenibacillus mucilaginosus]AFH64107.1 hypothetical protein B2K_26045 [Paenibacillus mucilaginosus K02]
MNEKEARRWRLDLLLAKRRREAVKADSPLFLDCIQALGEGTRICSREESDRLYARLQGEYPFTSYGRIDWERVPHQALLQKDVQLSAVSGSKEYWILWSHGDAPVIRTSLRKLLEQLDEVTAVSPDVWAYREGEEVVEWAHDGSCRRSLGR